MEQEYKCMKCEGKSVSEHGLYCPKRAIDEENKKLRKTTLEKFGEEDYRVTWWDGSCNLYKNLNDAVESIRKEFEENDKKS